MDKSGVTRKLILLAMLSGAIEGVRGPDTLTTASLVLVIATVAGSAGPALRAASRDPLDGLRHH